MSARRDKSSEEQEEFNFMRYVGILVFIIGMFHVAPAAHNLWTLNSTTTVLFDKESYELKADPKNTLDRYTINDWTFSTDMIGRAYVSVSGVVKGVNVSHKQEITLVECSIRDVNVTEKGIEYGLKTKDIEDGRINAEQVEDCLVRFFALLSEVSEHTAIRVAENKKQMIAKEINRSSFVKVDK